MNVLFRACRLEMDYEAYMDFLLRHAGELNLPYPFAMKLSFLASPLILGQAMLIFTEEPYEIVGAAGFVYGTGPGEYQDRHLCQIEIAYLRPEHRSTTLFARGLQELTALMRAGNPEVRQVQFWAPEDRKELGSLFAKLTALPGSSKSVSGPLALYSVLFDELAAYCRELRPANE
ncbi:hypothetical protein [Gorillibacterium sp. sgz5001074]|uniref:hypothetical protein n=1 Tax=Gorillibacterium sp. sgz5001074 TaxID=3446695 RepID=UPI003F6623F6